MHRAMRFKRWQKSIAAFEALGLGDVELEARLKKGSPCVCSGVDPMRDQLFAQLPAGWAAENFSVHLFLSV